MKKYSILIAAMLFLCSSDAISASSASGKTSIAEEQIRQERLSRAEEKKKKLFFNSFYEYGWVRQGFRSGNWQESSSRLAYSVSDMLTPYAAFNTYERFHKKDYTIDVGYDLNFGQSAYGNVELSVGADVDYVYRYRVSAGYGHRIYKTLFWELSTRYFEYQSNDVVLLSPGLIYYFGNHYLSANYGFSLTDSRGAAQWGVFKGNIAITDNLHFWGGMATGQRLYDIYELDASEQYGYIFFAGLDFKIVEQLNFRAGYSYSKERPNWQKNGINFGLNLKF